LKYNNSTLIVSVELLLICSIGNRNSYWLGILRCGSSLRNLMAKNQKKEI
jgi:hypothetical protein